MASINYREVQAAIIPAAVERLESSTAGVSLDEIIEHAKNGPRAAALNGVSDADLMIVTRLTMDRVELDDGPLGRLQVAYMRLPTGAPTCDVLAMIDRVLGSETRVDDAEALVRRLLAWLERTGEQCYRDAARGRAELTIRKARGAGGRHV